MIGALLRDTPFALPGLIVAAVVGYVASPIAARWFGLSPRIAWLLLTAMGGIAAVTLTPGIDAVIQVPPPTCPFSPLGTPHEDSLVDSTLNVALYVPLGLAVGAATKRVPVVLLLAVALPFAIERVQYVLPSFHRSCQSEDVIANLVGLALGMALPIVSRAIQRSR
jgi:VanZ family protein